MNAYSNKYTSTYTKKIDSEQGKNKSDKVASEKSKAFADSTQIKKSTENLSETYGKTNTASADIDKESTFPEVNILSKYSKYFKALNEHYLKVNEKNKKFADPEKHIYDKYYNKKS